MRKKIQQGPVLSSKLYSKAVCLRRNHLAAALFLSVLTVSGWTDTFTFSADRMNTVLAKGKERTLLSGNAKIISRNTVITADEIEIYGSDSQFALCRGNVTVKDEEKGIILHSENLFYDRENDVSRIEGYVEMEDQKNELVVKGGLLEHYGEQDITIIQIGVRILKEDMVCRSEFARFKREEEILELSGLPFVYWKGDEYRATRIIINLDTDEIRLEGEVRGTVTTEEEKDAPPVENQEAPGNSEAP